MSLLHVVACLSSRSCHSPTATLATSPWPGPACSGRMAVCGQAGYLICLGLLNTLQGRLTKQQGVVWHCSAPNGKGMQCHAAHPAQQRPSPTRWGCRPITLWPQWGRAAQAGNKTRKHNPSSWPMCRLTVEILPPTV